ncbi:maleylacetoacetate isomerase/maleylpyruvate isomerase [Sagittula marina]|uniref:Maleylacetoacetate isomerase/maleylpyruvate isomerase n=1 Tax=Sagittula marina TaxID=943940 RepID=A0A7W6DWJ3_9RHOB|nr:maleylacetoacetate isomerase [Sagittula marina]MBB3986579.1 maleylacetoacetate isomerase/maleylpyruvate isomerase [Sagittula marina]
MILYSYWRSTTSMRVRAALNVKGVAYDIAPVNLLEGAQRASDYAALNPVEAVPTLVLKDGTALTQSMAILDWLEETHPEPPLLPAAPVARAHVRAAAQTIAMDIHPVNNLKVLAHLKTRGFDDLAATDWICHWMARGLAAYQRLIAKEGRFSFGDELTQADLCLVAQMVNARRWGLDLAPLTRLTEIDSAVRDIPAIRAALPENQPDAPMKEAICP